MKRPRTDRPDARRIVERLAEAEQGLGQLPFVAPVLAGGTVAVKISGLVCRLVVRPAQAQGWLVLVGRPDGTAHPVRPAQIDEVDRYLRVLPAYRLRLLEQTSRGWLGIPASPDARLVRHVLYPVGLVTGAGLFDVVRVRFDGARFWFEVIDPRTDPSIADVLRLALARGTPPGDVAVRGLSRPEAAGYAYVYKRTRSGGPPTTRGRVQVALDHGGAILLSMEEQGHELTVRFRIGEHEHTAVVRPGDLSLVTAGFCMAGGEAQQDLASLVALLSHADDRFGGQPDYGERW